MQMTKPAPYATGASWAQVPPPASGGPAHPWALFEYAKSRNSTARGDPLEEPIATAPLNPTNLAWPEITHRLRW